MLSALIHSIRSYSAVRLAAQPIHQRYVQPGPLVLEPELRKYPAPAGGCKLTEPNFCRRLRNLREHEGLQDMRLIELLNHGRHFSFLAGSLVILGRNRADNEHIRSAMRGGDVIFRSTNVPGPTAIAIRPASEDLPAVRRLIAAYADHRDIQIVQVSEMHTASKPELYPEPVADREEFQPYLL